MRTREDRLALAQMVSADLSHLDMFERSAFVTRLVTEMDTIDVQDMEAMYMVCGLGQALVRCGLTDHDYDKLTTR